MTVEELQTVLDDLCEEAMGDIDPVLVMEALASQLVGYCAIYGADPDRTGAGVAAAIRRAAAALGYADTTLPAIDE